MATSEAPHQNEGKKIRRKNDIHIYIVPIHKITHQRAKRVGSMKMLNLTVKVMWSNSFGCSVILVIFLLFFHHHLLCSVPWAALESNPVNDTRPTHTSDNIFCAGFAICIHGWRSCWVKWCIHGLRYPFVGRNRTRRTGPTVCVVCAIRPGPFVSYNTIWCRRVLNTQQPNRTQHTE